jgi:hypothetical protein
LGVRRILGYVYAGLNILGGFILIGAGTSMTTQPSLGTGFSSRMFNQIGGFAFIYGGLAAIMMGILLIWALVKSGQIESIDRNIRIIAEWAKSRQSRAVITENQTKDVKSDSDKEIS